MEGSDRGRIEILVADDEPTSRLIAQIALRELGHECRTVTDGTEAWDACRFGRYDVVISDWMMPGLTGVELCAAIRAADSAGGRYTYFMMLTVLGTRDQITAGMEAGADDYLLKPIDPEDLRVRLIAAARVTALHRQLNDQRVVLEELNDKLTAISLLDPLTGLGNRRALNAELERLEARVVRYGQRYCLSLLDIDQFKAYNDTYGHQAGDRVLETVASQLQQQVRTGDGLFRYGGEEFLCVFPEQSADTATTATERMRGGLERLAIPHVGSTLGFVTLSAGLAIMDPTHERSAGEVLKRADEALYRAKQNGRNRVEHELVLPV